MDLEDDDSLAGNSRSSLLVKFNWQDGCWDSSDKAASCVYITSVMNKVNKEGWKKTSIVYIRYL